MFTSKLVLSKLVSNKKIIIIFDQVAADQKIFPESLSPSFISRFIYKNPTAAFEHHQPPKFLLVKKMWDSGLLTNQTKVVIFILSFSFRLFTYKIFVSWMTLPLCLWMLTNTTVARKLSKMWPWHCSGVAPFAAIGHWRLSVNFEQDSEMD